MRFFIFAILSAILHTASAFPYSAPPLPDTVQPFLNIALLPSCARSCKDLLETATKCSPPTAPVSNNATYIDCFCKNQWLRSLNDVGEICGATCNKKDEAVIERTYGSLCGVPSPYVTLSSTTSSPITPMTTSSISTVVASSLLAVAPAETSAPTTGEPQHELESSETWYVSTMNPAQQPLLLLPKPASLMENSIKNTPLTQGRGHKHWKSVVKGVLIPLAVLIFVAVVALLYAWYTRIHARRRDRPMTREELEQYQEHLLQERLVEQGYIPLQTVDNSFRGRLGLRKSKAPSRDQISNRRTRRRNLSISTTAPLMNPSPYSEQGTWTPRRPASARTAASSIGQRSASSPLSPFPTLSPPLPVNPATLRTPAPPRIPATPQTPTAQRSISSPFPPTTAHSDAPLLPPIRSCLIRSATAHSLRFYKAE